MKCPKCKGNLIPDEYWNLNGEHCRFRRCLQCGDIDFGNGTHEIKIRRKKSDVNIVVEIIPSFSMIGKMMGITKQRVDQLEKTAIKKLRRIFDANHITRAEIIKTWRPNAQNYHKQ